MVLFLKRITSTSLLAVLSYFLLIGLSSCSSSDENDSTLNPLEVFRGTVYSFTQKKCASCHSLSVSPVFADTDVEKAYQVSKLFVNFDNPGASRLLTKATDGHSPAAVPDNREELLKSITSWAGAEKAATAGSGSGINFNGVITTVKVAPGDLSTGLAWNTLEWDLSASSGGAKFQVDIQSFQSDLSHYRFTKPRIVTGTEPLMLKNIYILVNKKIDIRFVFLTERTVGAPGYTNPVSRATLIVPKDKGEGIDEIVIGFEKLERSDTNPGAPVDPGSAKFITFVNDVKPVLQEKCMNCHSTNGNAARTAFPMPRDTDQNLLDQVIQRVNSNDAPNSPLIRRGTTLPMGPLTSPALDVQGDATAIEAIIRWIRMPN